MIRRSARGGFTLIEMLITVALSTLVGILIYTVFIEQTRAYRMQADMGNMQQNLRVAMEMMTRDIATAGWGAGYNGGSWGVDGQDGSPNAAIYSLRIRDDFPAGSGRDAVEIMMMDPDRSTWAFTDAGVAETCDTAVITLAPADSALAAEFSDAGPNEQIMCFSQVGMGGRSHSYIWDVVGAGDAATGQVPVTANAQNDYLDECIAGLPKHMVCGPMVWIAYYIDVNSSDLVGIGSEDLPVLYLVPDLQEASLAGGYPTVDDIPVALGIEDLQFEVCEAGTGLDCELDASWTSGYDLDGSVGPAANSWQNLASVRVLMTARTLRPDQERTSVSQQIDIVSSDTYTPPFGLDSYHRRVARTEVTVRNAIGVWQLLNQPF